jgi:hypothetical protein
MWKFADEYWRERMRAPAMRPKLEDIPERKLAKFAMTYAEQTERDHEAW